MILIISNNAWNLYNFRSDLLNILSQDNKIILCCNKDKYSQKLKSRNIIFKNFNLKKSRYNFFIDLYYLIKLFLIIIFYRPKYILSFTIKPNIYTSFIAKFIKTKVITNITGLGSIYLSTNILNKFIFYIYKNIVQNNYHILFQNKSDQQIFFGKSNNLKSSENYSVIPGSGINIDNLKYSKLISENNYFVFVGRIIKDKGFYELVEAIKIVKQNKSNIKFVVVGSLDSDNPSQITSYELNKWIDLNYFDYFGYSDEVEEIIKKSMCVILPSYREGSSRVLLEAMAIGRPIITTDVPGCKELVDHGLNGLLVQSRNAEDLSKKILEYDELTLKQKINMGYNGRIKVVNSYNVKYINNKYLDLIK